MAGEAIFGAGVATRALRYFSTPRADTTAFPELTPREREVLTLIASGLSNAAIASRLGLATNTVGNHISNIFAVAGGQPGGGHRTGPVRWPRRLSRRPPSWAGAVVDCIYGVDCGPRSGGGSRNRRADGQLAAEPGCGAGDACGAGGATVWRLALPWLCNRTAWRFWTVSGCCPLSRP